MELRNSLNYTQIRILMSILKRNAWLHVCCYYLQMNFLHPSHSLSISSTVRSFSSQCFGALIMDSCICGSFKCGHVSVFQLAHLVNISVSVNAWLGTNRTSFNSFGTNHIGNICHSVPAHSGCQLQSYRSLSNSFA